MWIENHPFIIVLVTSTLFSTYLFVESSPCKRRKHLKEIRERKKKKSVQN